MSRTLRLGLFIVSTLSMLAVGSFLIGARQYFFSSTYPLKTTFRTVSGLSEGAEVRIGGVQAGVVRRILLPDAPGGAITVVMALDHATGNVVRTDSVASIGTEGLLGNKFVEISSDSTDAPPVTPWATIESAPVVDMSDVVTKADAVLGDMKAITEKIDEGIGTVGALVNDRSVYNQLNKATAQATAGAAAFSDDMEALKHNFLLRGYFDRRGYEDSSGLTQHLIDHLPHETSMRSFHYDVKKVFTDTDHAKLRDEKSFDEAGRFLERYPFGLAVIVANGGSTGDTEALHTLLRARAMVIREYLVNHFKVDDVRVKTLDVPKTPDATSDAGTVDIVVYPTAVKPPGIPGP